jgi:phosphoglycolate phosphatase
LPGKNVLLLDLDGTLADTRADIAFSLNYTLERFGHPHRDINEITLFVGDGVKPLLQKAFGPETDDMIAQALLVFESHYFEHCTDATKLYANVAETLEFFNGLPMAVVTNKPQRPSEKLLDALNIGKHFKAVLGGDAVKKRKPAPEHVQEALAHIGAASDGALIVGDSANDVLAGKAAGIATCAVTYGFRPRAELEETNPDFLIADFSELRRIVR